MRERTLTLGYGREMFGGLRIAAAAKHLQHAYDPAPEAALDPVFRSRLSRDAVTFDAGAVFSLSRRLQLGAVYRNCNQPDLGVSMPDIVRREVQMGFSLNFPGIKVRTAGDMFYRNAVSSDEDTAVVSSLGVEKFLDGDRFALRAGVNDSEVGVGFGYRGRTITLDYALVITSRLSGSHVGGQQVGFTYRFRSREKSR
jgi:hypothetical protein